MTLRGIHLLRDLRQIGQRIMRGDVRDGRVIQTPVKQERNDSIGLDMRGLVLGARRGSQILRAIVVAHAVEMVNVNRGRQRGEAARLEIYESMFQHIAAAGRQWMTRLMDLDVSVMRSVAASLPQRIVRAAPRAQVMSCDEALRKSTELSLCGIGTFRNSCLFATTAFTETSWWNPSLWRRGASRRLRAFHRFNTRMRAKTQVMSLNEPWLAIAVTWFPWNRLIATALTHRWILTSNSASIDARVGTTDQTIPMFLNFPIMPAKKSRRAVNMNWQWWNRLGAAALTFVGLNCHASSVTDITRILE